MLDDVVANYLETLSELDFFDAFQAILRANGFYDISRTHGSAEFGRDFIAKRSEKGVLWQYAIQTKAGNINQQGWRNVLGQINEIRLQTTSNPGFDPGLPRRAVLATTGRLVGNAPTGAHDYKLHHDSENFVFEVWPVEHLLEMMVDAPEIGLAGGMEAPILGAIAAIHVRTFTEQHLEELSLNWIEDGSSRLWRSALVALVIAARLARSGRTDLASLVGAHLVRSVWASVHGEEPAPKTAVAVANVGSALLRYHARSLLAELSELPAGSRGLIWATQDVGTIVTYPIRCLRLLELFGLAGLAEIDADARREFIRACQQLIADQPGAWHPPSDNWAVSIIPAALLLWHDDAELVGKWLEQVCVWVADRYDRGETGLARPLASAEEEVRQLLGGRFGFMKVRRRPESFIASVLLDLSAALELPDVYNAIVNEVMAVEACPQVVECDDDQSQYRDTLEGVRIELWMRYDERFDTQSGWQCAPHHRRFTPHYLERLGRYWDFLVLSTVMRDRCFPSVIREIAGLPVLAGEP